MKVYKIPDSFAHHYHGAGYALAAICGGEVVKIVYIEDVAENSVVEQILSGGDHAAFFVGQWLKTRSASPVVRELSIYGQLSVGMCSCWEFCEL